MSQTLALNDIVELRFYCQAGEQYSVNTRHYEITAVDGTSISDDALLTFLDALWGPALKANMSEYAVYLGSVAQIIKPTRRPGTFTSATAGIGNKEGALMPKQAAGLVSFLSDFATRSGRGRMFVPFPSVGNETTDGKPDAEYLAYLGVIGALADNVQTVGTVPNQVVATPVVLNRVSGDTKVITHYAARSVWATCKRRSDIRGADRPPF